VYTQPPTMRMLVDVDEVLSNFGSYVLESAGSYFQEKAAKHSGHSWDFFEIFSPEEQNFLHEMIEKEGFCASIPLQKGAQEAVRELRKLVDVYVVTSPYHSMPWVHERNQWLKEHFGFGKNEIVHTSAKFLVNGDIFLDDKPDNVLSWHKEHPRGLAMIWPSPFTRSMPVDFVRDWGHVLGRVSQKVLVRQLVADHHNRKGD